ncbi:MAG: hypothetical protein M0Z66_14935 [Thermaerobacter sp.]|nr:hypothetical protein [Thermaerobacter sp.]
MLWLGGIRLLYRKWSPLLVTPPGSSAAALPASLLAAGAAAAALVAGEGASRVPLAILLALAIALPFLALAMLERQIWDRELHLRIGQLQAMRTEKAWQEESMWELSDRVALLLRLDGARIDYVPHWVEADEAFFAVIGTRGKGRLVVRIVRDGPLTRDDLALALGRAAMEDARDLLLVVLGSIEPDAAEAAGRKGGQIAVEIWRVPDLLARAEEHSQAG